MHRGQFGRSEQGHKIRHVLFAQLARRFVHTSTVAPIGSEIQQLLEQVACRLSRQMGYFVVIAHTAFPMALAALLGRSGCFCGVARGQQLLLFSTQDTG